MHYTCSVFWIKRREQKLIRGMATIYATTHVRICLKRKCWMLLYQFWGFLDDMSTKHILRSNVTVSKSTFGIRCSGVIFSKNPFHCLTPITGLPLIFHFKIPWLFPDLWPISRLLIIAVRSIFVQHKWKKCMTLCLWRPPSSPNSRPRQPQVEFYLINNEANKKMHVAPWNGLSFKQF